MTMRVLCPMCGTTVQFGAPNCRTCGEPLAGGEQYESQLPMRQGMLIGALMAAMLGAGFLVREWQALPPGPRAVSPNIAIFAVFCAGVGALAGATVVAVLRSIRRNFFSRE